MAHPHTTRRLRSTLLLPLLGLLVVAACGNSSSEPDGAGGAGASSGGSASSGAGGTSAATAGAGTAGSTAGSTAGNPASGGGGASGGAATGGASGSGADAGTGGGGSAAGGASTAGAGGSGGSGGSAGSAGAAGSGGSGGSGAATLHIFMLMGQSNMVGVAKYKDSDKNTDPRIKVWGGCKQPAGQWNVATPPLNDCPGESGINLSDTVDPGIWFAKTLLKKLPAGDTIGLVGTAESGEKIETFIQGGTHHAMIMKKIAAVKTAQNARFAGVIFHQGESNTGQQTWPALVVQLYTEVKQAFGVSYDVPFILGELPNGGCCSSHNTRVREAAMKLPMGAYVPQDGTKVMDQYHFDHDSVVLMGTRYGDKMVEMLKW